MSSRLDNYCSSCGYKGPGLETLWVLYMVGFDFDFDFGLLTLADGSRAWISLAGA